MSNTHEYLTRLPEDVTAKFSSGEYNIHKNPNPGPTYDHNVDCVTIPMKDFFELHDAIRKVKEDFKNFKAKNKRKKK